MILERLTIEDFGVYGGKQSIDLAPPAANQPVILIGGLNGRGKTTLLDALQLVLYGKFAVCSNRNGHAYEDFLRESIHRGAEKPASGLELEFSHSIDGSVHQFRICRSWKLTNKSLSERFDVFRDGERDDLIAENWVSYVESILPRRVANLFFFDGEKIEAYASSETAAALIENATHMLLGMDIVEQLERDLEALKVKNRQSSSNTKLQRELDDARLEFDRYKNERQTTREKVAQLRSHKLAHVERQLSEVELELRQKGGDVFDRQKEIEAELEEATQEVLVAEETLRTLASGALPLMLLSESLGHVEVQANSEIAFHSNARVADELRNRNKRLLAFLEGLNLDAKTEKKVKTYLNKDQQTFAERNESDAYLELAPSTVPEIGSLLTITLEEDRGRLIEALDELRIAQRQRADKEAEKSSIPAIETIQHLITRREAIKGEIAAIAAEIRDEEDALHRASTMHMRTKQTLANILKKKVDAEFESEDQERIVHHAARVQGTLKKFRTRAVARNIGRIEEYIGKSLRQLFNKRSLASAVKINPETFEMKVLNDKGKLVPQARLSAGERQLLAISTLWGLAQASGRQLPTIVDTPLGRLDSKHRKLLVSKYFPNASHQVILLSTDEEISDGHLNTLNGAIGRSFRLEFDETLGSTRIEEGYFVEEVDRVH